MIVDSFESFLIIWSCRRSLYGKTVTRIGCWGYHSLKTRTLRSWADRYSSSLYNSRWWVIRIWVNIIWAMTLNSMDIIAKIVDTIYRHVAESTMWYLTHICGYNSVTLSQPALIVYAQIIAQRVRQCCLAIRRFVYITSIRDSLVITHSVAYCWIGAFAFNSWN